VSNSLSTQRRQTIDPAPHRGRCGLTTAYEEARSRGVAKLPLGRMASAEEIADAVIFLASAKAGYITGVTLSMDGGQNPVVL
jgi:NAD(P)-dependent dehydrogenase (short-subunit alcohol dehydrogenase family)